MTLDGAILCRMIYPCFDMKFGSEKSDKWVDTPDGEM